MGMAEATNELMYELLKRMNHGFTEMRRDITEIKTELNVVRGHLIGIQTDIHNIYGMLARHDERLDRIERRLDLREFAEPQRPIQP